MPINKAAMVTAWKESRSVANHCGADQLYAATVENLLLLQIIILTLASDTVFSVSRELPRFQNWQRIRRSDCGPGGG